MIEIIREEKPEPKEKRRLPKEIRQIGTPDVGVRIYLEHQVHEFLHPYGDEPERAAYVLLGHFEHDAGRSCVFVEAAIWLKEVVFEGGLPDWNDQTWGYIYRQLKKEYDDMVIVGWALDIRGQLPNMTAQLERMHREHFGGTHQILFLMDSLEREEAFYSSRGGHLYRREGFYIYYARNAAPMEKLVTERAETTGRQTEPEWDRLREWERQKEAEQQSAGKPEQKRQCEPEQERLPESAYESELVSGQEEPDDFWWKNENETADTPMYSHREGDYRKRLHREETARQTPSYATGLLVLCVVGALGMTAYTNHQKMNEMEETLARINQSQTIAAETETQETVRVESVAGNIAKQSGEQTAAAETAGETAQTADGTTAQTSDGETAQTTDGATAQNVSGTQNADGATEQTTDSAAAQNVSDPQTSDSVAEQTTGSATAQNASGTQGSDGASVQTGTDAQTYLQQGYYIVQKGDSLVGICRKIYQTTAMMDKLCEVNGIEDENAIYEGQYLTLPNQ